VTRWLERFAIGDLAARRARTLSGGEAQRTALARALVVEPELLLLDEPFSALDQPTRDTLLRDLRGILTAERVTTVLVTHHRGEALALGDRLAVLIGGEILQIGAAAEVFRAPRSAEVARFVGLETIVEGVAVAAAGARSSLAVGAHRIQADEPTRTGERVLVCVRAEDVSLHAPGADAAGANRLDGRVTHATPTPLHVRVTVDCGFPLVALVTHRLAGEWDVREGMAVTAVFGSGAVHLIRPAVRSSSDAMRQGPRLDTASRRGV
jgi:ABC-type Fe3+/spermidine/putrescine transport system ATPase subunit